MKNTEPAKRDLDRGKLRKRTELSLAVPILAIFLLVSPLLNAFTNVDGQPQFSSVIIYIFAVWGALILAAFIMSRVLSSTVADD
tara:strand:+ start:52721 stop:52972 length:252 start_codon:yes stop_codon:yes gene_type:complete